MKTYLSIASNTLFQLLSRTITAVSGLLVIRLITYYYGLDGFGQFQIVLGYVTLWWILTDFGLNAVVVREITGQPSKTQAFFSALLSLRTFLALVLILVSNLIVHLLPYSPMLRLTIFLASLTILSQAVLGACNAIFQVNLRYDRQLLANLAGSSLYLALVFWFTRLEFDLARLGLAFVVGQITMAVVGGFLTRRWVQIQLSFDFPFLKHVLSLSLLFGLALLFSLASFKIDVVLLSVLPLTHHTPAQAVGIYQLGYKVFELVLVLPIFFMNATYPVLVRHFEQGLALFWSSLRKTLAILTAAGVLISLMLYFAAPYIIPVLGELTEFEDSIKVLRILVLGMLFFYVTPPLMWCLVIFREQSLLIYVYAVAFVFNLVSNLILIPRFTFWAAAWITSGTELLILLLQLFFVMRKLRYLKRS